jgi:hypothetical protein
MTLWYLNLSEEDRQMTILALAELAHQRPGFADALRRIAGQFNALGAGSAECGQMFDRFVQLAKER